MIVEKPKPIVCLQQKRDTPKYKQEPIKAPVKDENLEEIEDNPLVDTYHAVKRILSTLKKDPRDSNSRPLFETIQIDNGQFERIVRTRGNTEFAVGFPAAFIRFVNVRYLVAQQRIGEGRATMRIRYILNNLNISDADVEVEGFYRFQQINNAIQDAKDFEPALNERCNLTYFDMPQSMAHGLQPYWIDYEIWFRTSSSFQYRNWVERYLVMPPFTNHSDAPEHDTEHHGDHMTPTIEDVSRFTPSVESWLTFSLPTKLR